MNDFARHSAFLFLAILPVLMIFPPLVRPKANRSKSIFFFFPSPSTRYNNRLQQNFPKVFKIENASCCCFWSGISQPKRQKGCAHALEFIQNCRPAQSLWGGWRATMASIVIDAMITALTTLTNNTSEREFMYSCFIMKGGTQGFPRHEVSDKQEVLFEDVSPSTAFSIRQHTNWKCRRRRNVFEQNFLFVAHFVSGKPLCPALHNITMRVSSKKSFTLLKYSCFDQSEDLSDFKRRPPFPSLLQKETHLTFFGMQQQQRNRETQSIQRADLVHHRGFPW